MDTMNSWLVARYDKQLDKWFPLLGSYGRKKEYVRGYLNALLEFYPRPRYRIYNPDGEIVEETEESGGVRI
jgi:hypothetical protein